MTTRRWAVLVVGCWAALSGTATLQDRTMTVTGSVSVAGRNAHPDLADVAIWLQPTGDPARAREAAAAKPRLRMVQENKLFDPHLLLVRVGTVVDFPNADPFFHNVFSMYNGKRFDLGLYEGGASRSVTFGNPGICYVFCNIHPEMSAVILVLDTPFYAVSTRAGAFAIPDVPAGRYTLSVWHERYTLASPSEIPREVTISDATRALGVIRLVDAGKVIAPHKNKYGHDYIPPAPASPVYK